jgi:NADPH:quinone reductase-like Zn-dependent oxidoreductase
MKAAVVHSYNAPPGYADFADPAPTSDEVLVTVAAAGLHQIVKSLANGKHYLSTGNFPFVPGVDGVGRLEDGSRVYFGASHSPFGTFAERSIAARGRTIPIPDSLDDVTVAAMMNPGMASWGALTERAQFAAGESVLILGATGNAGRLAVQVAKRLGARRIVAAGRDPQVLEKTRSLGADAIISLQLDPDALVSAFRQEFASNRIDVILDYVWGPAAEAVLAAIAQRGLDHDPTRIRYVQIGSTAGPTITLPAATLRSSGLELLGSGFGSISMERLFASLAAFMAAAGKAAADNAPLTIATATAPLRDVESLWNAPDHGARLVFQP